MNELSLTGEKIPEKLKIIPETPSILYAKGNLNLLNSDSVAIIGSRQASESGKRLAMKFAYELSSTGITIVSGLARGIDTIAHTYSYSQKGKTIAVLGCGFNKIFPPENLELYRKILDNDGLILSEYSPDTEAHSSFFTDRNRIISGLSLGILVIEAKARSGTSTTAKHAHKQHKPVFVLPHEIDNPHGIGTNRLLKKGATLVTNTSDILDKLKLSEYIEIYEKQKKNIISTILDKAIKANKVDNPASPPLVFSDPKQAKIFELITETPITPNDLARKTGYSINEVQSILFLLEIDGYIKKVPGGYICM